MNAAQVRTFTMAETSTGAGGGGCGYEVSMASIKLDATTGRFGFRKSCDRALAADRRAVGGGSVVTATERRRYNNSFERGGLARCLSLCQLRSAPHEKIRRHSAG